MIVEEVCRRKLHRMPALSRWPSIYHSVLLFSSLVSYMWGPVVHEVSAALSGRKVAGLSSDDQRLFTPSAHVRRQSFWPPTLNKIPLPFTFYVVDEVPTFSAPDLCHLTMHAV